MCLGEAAHTNFEAYGLTQVRETNWQTTIIDWTDFFNMHGQKKKGLDKTMLAIIIMEKSII
jgi:hypothetical protein